MAKRKLILVGGPNGAGKTTFAMEDVARHGGVYLGADAIAAELSPDDPAKVAIEAGRIFLERFDQLIQAESRLIVESTLSGKSLANRIAFAKTLGFSVSVKFVFLDSAESSLVRVALRVANGGHDVPPEDIRRRFHRSLTNFWTRYRVLADDWLLIYNSRQTPVAVASAAGDQVTVYREELYSRFLQMVRGPNP